MPNQSLVSDGIGDLNRALDHKPVLPPTMGKGQVLGEASLNVARVLLKCSFFQDQHGYLVPRGIEDRGEHNNRAIVGYKDDGKQEIGAHVVDVSVLRVGMANNRYFLNQAWVNYKMETDLRDASRRRKKIVVNMQFERGDAPTDLDRKLVGGLRDLANTVWKDCYVWANPDNAMSPGKSVTINLRAPMNRNRPAETKLKIEGGVLVAESLPR